MHTDDRVHTHAPRVKRITVLALGEKDIVVYWYSVQ